MFNSKPKGAARPETAAAATKPAAPSIISSDLSINGNLNSDGDIQVDGTVEGDIVSNKLRISSTAVVARHVTLIKTARVIADVIQERLSIEPGAFFEGNCRHFPAQEEKKTQAKIEALKPHALGDDDKRTASGDGAAAAAAT
jgi:cytoskeletal protein CcmA (bactofilin family)